MMMMMYYMRHHRGAMLQNRVLINHSSFTLRCHSLLLFARRVSSSKEAASQSCRSDPSGTSVPPFTYACRVRRTSLSEFMRRTCPRNLSLRFRIASSRSYDGLQAVSRYGCLVIVCKHLLLNPFNILRPSSVSCHASHAWVSVEQTETL